MSTDAKLHSTPQRERAISLALQVFGGDVARAIVQSMETCLNCQHFDEPSELCALAGQRPPARVIAHGCPMYAPAVPF